tara:strand:+ start:818 stop:1219 length:402 start_codon:yes stop_codon:yes gene_type:complete
MNHRIGKFIFAVIIGFIVAVSSFNWIVNPEGREERILQIAAVESARAHIMGLVESKDIELVDPLSPNRKVGKVYIYPEGNIWSISGFYRRNNDDVWHPYLMMLSENHNLISLKLKDKAFYEIAKNNSVLEYNP